MEEIAPTTIEWVEANQELIEKLGTGTEDIITKCREYGLRTPEFHQDEDFRVIIWREQHENDPRRSEMIQSDPRLFQKNKMNFCR